MAVAINVEEMGIEETEWERISAKKLRKRCNANTISNFSEDSLRLLQ
jgi:hypothetical protein